MCLRASRSAARVGDQSTLLRRDRRRCLQFRNGGIERGFGRGYVRLHAANVGLDRSHFSGNGADIFLLLFRLRRDTRRCGLLLTLQVPRPRAASSFFVMPICCASVSESASAACMRLVRSPIVLLAGGLILRQLLELAVLVIDEIRRRAGEGNGQHNENPFPDIALRLGW